MNKFDWDSKRLVYLRGAGNPDFRQYADIAPVEIKLVDSIEQAQSACQEYIAKWQLGGGNWYALERPYPGDVFDLSGKLVQRIAYNCTIHEPEEERSLPATSFKLEFCSWTTWQTDRLESELQKIGATEIITENWTRGQDSPAVLTYCDFKGELNAIAQAAKASSEYIHLGWIGLDK